MMAGIPERSWRNGFKHYLDSGEDFDFTIHCRNYEWKVHRLIIGAASTYFKRIASGTFKESSEGLADLSDDHPEIIARLIVYMYFGQHPDQINKFHCQESHVDWQASLAKLLDLPREAVVDTTLLVQAGLLAAADKYQMPADFIDGCKLAYLNRAESVCKPPFPEDAVVEFFESVRAIHRTLPVVGLKGRAITTAQDNLDVWQHRQDFQDLMQEIPEFVIDIATKGHHYTLWCKRCGQYEGFYIRGCPKKLGYLWDWIDYGKCQDWKTFPCKHCHQKYTSFDEEPIEID